MTCGVTSIYIKKNIENKLQKLGLSEMTSKVILGDVFAKPKGRLFEESPQLPEQANSLMKKWDDLESKERDRKPQFFNVLQEAISQ